MTTFDLRTGKTLKYKEISFDGTLLTETSLKPLFALLDKHRGQMYNVLEKSSNTGLKIDLDDVPSELKLSLKSKLGKLHILVERSITEYPTKDNPDQTPRTKLNHYFHRIYSDKELLTLQSAGYTIDNLIKDKRTNLTDDNFVTKYIIDGFYCAGSYNSLAPGRTLGEDNYNPNLVVRDLIHSYEG